MKKNLIAIGVGVIILVILAIYLPPRELSAPTDDSQMMGSPDDQSGMAMPSDDTQAATDAGQLSTQYITADTWPPQFSVTSAPFACSAGGSDTSPDGKTQERMINGQDYCVTTATEGAAGSTYTKYTYETMLGDQNVSTTFTLQYVDCDNYDEPQATACKQERAGFDIDSIVDGMLRDVPAN